eukprot:gene12900-14229_t
MQIIEYSARVQKDENVKVRWLDGSVYEGTVIAMDTAAVKVIPDGFPQGYELWVPANAIDTPAASTLSEKSVNANVQLNTKIALNLNGRKTDGLVTALGPQKVFWGPEPQPQSACGKVKRVEKAVTYDGWGNIYDEYVEPKQCTEVNSGQQVTDSSKILKNSKLKVKWLDGSTYSATVLNTSSAVAKVRPSGYPTEYTIWVTEKEMLNSATENVSSSLQTNQSQAAEVTRNDEIPKKKILDPKSPTHKDSIKWNKMLSKTLISDAIINKIKERISKLKKPAWAGNPLGSAEYHVAIGASKEDMEFAEGVEAILKKMGLKATTDQEELHNSRTFLLIYSDTVNMDENIIRHLTRAAERFNMGETVILSLVRPGCPKQVIDRVPDRVAYSLSNVVVFNFDCFGEPEVASRKAVMNDLHDIIKNNAEETMNYDLTGVWLCKAIVTSQVTNFSSEKDFTLLIKQQGNKITGRTVDMFRIEGSVEKNFIKLRLTYRGEHKQYTELWEEKDYYFTAEIAAIIHNQGYRLEGVYFEETDAGTESKSGASKFDSLDGPFSATLEKQALSGYYNCTYYNQKDKLETIALVHQGGSEVIADFSFNFGITSVCFLDSSTGSLMLNSCENKSNSRTFLGKLTQDTDGSVAFQCLRYGSTFGLGEKPEPVSLTRDQFHTLRVSSDCVEDDELLEQLHHSESARPQGMPFTPGSYAPLSSDEFAVVIFCSANEEEKAVKLKQELEAVQEIEPVSLDFNDWKKSRTIVLLLSKHTQSNTKLIAAIEDAAEEEIPIFNIGLDSWFSIFGSENWQDQELRLKLMNALARLNQTPESTLDPKHTNFYGLIKGIRKRIDSPKFNLTGLYGVEVVGTNPPEEVTKYSNLEDETVQMVNKPSMIFIYFDVVENKISMATDYIVTNLVGEVEPNTYTMTMRNDAGTYELRINEDMDKMFGKYFSKRTNKEHTLLLHRAEGSMSGVYVMGKEQSPTGIVQLGKRAVDVSFGGYLLPAVMSRNQLIFNAPCPMQKNIFLTYTARALQKPDGNYLYGNVYTSKVASAIINFDAKQYIARLQKVQKKKTDEKLEAEGWLLNIVETYWRSLESGDYDGFLEVAKDGMETTFAKASFDKETINHLKMQGKYIPNSAVFTGKKAQIQMGKPIGQTRFDFKMDFEKCTQVGYYIGCGDSDHKLHGIMSYEEEEEFLHSSQYDIMISYRSWDARWVDLLQAFLEQNGYTVWRDRRMDVGVNWSEDITRAVRRAGCVLAAISENYLTSVLCTKEVRMASDISKPVIPLVLPETCPKENPAHKLVSSSYKEKNLPITIASELSEITWVDFRPLANLDSSDPSNVKEFGKKYGTCLQSLLRMLEEIMDHGRVVDLQGDWDVVVGENDREQKMTLSLLASMSSEVEGVMSSDIYEDADIPLHKKDSWCHGSNLHMLAQYKGKGKSLDFTFDCKVSADGDSFAGLCRIHNTPWENPTEGKALDPTSIAMTYYETSNDCAVLPARGVRKGKRLDVEFQCVETGEFILDMEHAYSILKDAYKGMKRDQIEASITTFLETFKKYDRDGSHCLDMDELELALRVANMNCSAEDKQRIMKELDVDGSGTIEFYEFLAYIAKLRQNARNKAVMNSPAAKMVSRGFVSRLCSIQ